MGKLFGGFRTRQEQLDAMEQKINSQGISRKPLEPTQPKRKAPIRKQNMGPPSVAPVPELKTKPKTRKKKMSLDEINARIKALQKEIDADRAKRQKSIELLNRKHR